MNVKEVLENYNVYKLRITIKEKEIDKLKNELYGLQSQKLDGMPKPKGFTTSKLEEMIIRVEGKISKKEEYINELKNNIRIIDELIKTLKRDSQNIIEMRYIQKMSIEEIMDKDKKKRSYKTIQKIISKSINIMQLEYAKNMK